mgnify:CR=1 FL=1
MLGLLNTVLSKGNTLLTYVKDGLVMANRFLTPPKLTFPVSGSAAFNGTSDYIDTGIDIDTTQSKTFSAWVYFNNITTSQSIIGDGYPSNSEAAFSIIHDNNHTMLVSYGSSSRIFSNAWPNLNDWGFVSAVFESESMKVYLNGSLIGTQAYYNTNPQHSRSSFVGARRHQNSPYNAIQFWNGNLANVAIWNRALSSDEINSVMWKPVQALTATESNGLQAWYSLDDIASPTASLASMEQLATDKDVTIENKAAITAAVNSLS